MDLLTPITPHPYALQLMGDRRALVSADRQRRQQRELEEECTRALRVDYESRQHRYIDGPADDWGANDPRR